jgi:hypothetical protein
MEAAVVIGYLTVEAQIEADFDYARRWANFKRVLAWLRGECNRLQVFDEARKAHRAHHRRYLGQRVVEVSKIVGSVDRYRDFDRDFMPIKASVARRWKRVDRAFRSDEALPPVKLHKIGRFYFVEDGNHRVSVARYQRIEWIDAVVVEFLPANPQAQVPMESDEEERPWSTADTDVGRQYLQPSIHPSG